MKPLLIALTILASVFTKTSFANDEKVAPVVLHSFENTFTTAKDADWTYANNLYKVVFTLNGQYATAYYDAEGSMIALTRNITSLQLPVTLQATMKKGLENYWITDLFEMTNSDGTQYYATLENANSKVVLKSESSSSWSVYQKAQKL